MVERDDDRRSGEGRDDFDDPDAPASAEEVAASKRLRDALAAAEVRGGDAAPMTGDADPEVELALSLRAAWDPASLSSDENRAVLDATPTAEELALATSLRDALATGSDPALTDHHTLHLARALRAAYHPSAIDEVEHRAIVDAALAKMPAQRQDQQRAELAKKGADVVVLRPAKQRRVVRVAFGVVTGGLALAASIVLVVTQAPTRGSANDGAALAKARTTQPLFSEPFKAGETSARIDRIASARASDFRDNRFTKWGVR